MAKAKKCDAARSDPAAAQYDRHRDKMADASRERSKAGRELGEIAAVANAKRRAKGEQSLKFFLKEYFPERFRLDWSPDHLKAIERIESAVRSGGRFALAMPRGSGKTTMCECAVLWAVLYGYQDFAVLIGASAYHATNMLDSIKAELVDNERLAEDFPEVCTPILAIGGNPLRCNGQLHQGKATKIQWKRSHVVLPTIAGSKCSEAVLRVSGIMGSIRGLKYTRSDGRISRPTLVLVDDPQTDISAGGAQQCQRRIDLLNGAILKLAGPGKSVAAVCPCTVIRKGDAAHTLLDREKSPAWKGETFKTLYQFPDRMDLWQRYAIARADSLRAGGDGDEAQAFYREHRAEMDRGAVVAWPARFGAQDVSALEVSMRAYYEDKRSFFAEMQNDPIDEELGENDLTPKDIVGRLSGRGRGLVPIWAGKVTAFVDVQKSALYWLVAAWDSSCFTGTVIDYGVWPDQSGRRYYTLATLQQTLQNTIPGCGLEAQIRAALEQCAGSLLSRDWQRDDGVAVRIDRLFVDAGFQTEAVYEWARSSQHASVVVPTHGRAISAKNKPLDQYTAKPGERKGFHWFLTAGGGKRAVRHLLIDTHFWKSFLVQRFRVAIGDPSAMTVFGRSRQDADHDMLADHLCAERSTRVEANGRTIDEWDLRPGRPDNHWLDCLVGATAAASFEGAALVGQAGPAKPKVSWREQQQRKLHGR